MATTTLPGYGGSTVRERENLNMAVLKKVPTLAKWCESGFVITMDTYFDTYADSWYLLIRFRSGYHVKIVTEGHLNGWDITNNMVAQLPERDLVRWALEAETGASVK